MEVSECGQKNGNSDTPQAEVESDEARPEAEQFPALSGNVDGQKPPLPEEAKALSKNAQKVLAKQERFKQAKQQRKAHEKEHRHQETERKRREWQEKLANLPEEEIKKAQEEKMGLRAARKEERKGRKDKLIHAMAEGQNIVIDLEFGEKMKANEISSLVQQVRTHLPRIPLPIVPLALWNYCEFADLGSVVPNISKVSSQKSNVD